MKPYVIDDLLEHSASAAPDRTAVIHKHQTYTYGEIYLDALKMNQLVQEMGVRRDDRVGILLHKSIEQLVAMFGVSMAGGIFVFINPVLKKDQIEHIIRDCDIALLITTKALYTKNGLSLPPERTVCAGADDAGGPSPSWHAVHKTLPGRAPRDGRIADDIACLIYTSGSSGLPKGVVVPHRTVVEGAEIVSSYLGITGEDRLISVLPFNFDYGLNQATSAVLHGATLVMHDFFLVGDLLQVLKDERITGFAGMSPIWVKMFNDRHAPAPGYEFPHLKYITNTGGKVHRTILDRMRAFFPKSRIFLMYGLTEAFRSTYLPPEQLDSRPESIGKAIPNVDIMVVNSRGGECAAHEPGELVHRGALVTLGYWNDPHKTARVFRKSPRLAGQPHLHQPAVYSGDIVKKDDEGFLYFVSRKDDMIKTSGYRVSPTEIEGMLVGIGGISNAVVFGRETESAGQVVVAVIETPLGPDDTAAILRECKKRLPGYMVPQEIHCEASFRKTASGKVDRAHIKQKWLSGGVRDET